MPCLFKITETFEIITPFIEPFSRRLESVIEINRKPLKDRFTKFRILYYAYIISLAIRFILLTFVLMLKIRETSPEYYRTFSRLDPMVTIRPLRNKLFPRATFGLCSMSCQKLMLKIWAKTDNAKAIQLNFENPHWRHMGKNAKKLN